MEIVTLNPGTTTLTNKELETAISKLSVQVTGANNGAVTPEAVLAELLGSATITIQKQDSQNTTTVIQSMPLAHLAEISAHNAGVVGINTNGANSTAKFTIELTDDAALQMGDNSKFLVSIAGLPAAVTFIMDALDHHNSTNVYIAYENKFVNANVGKDFDIDGAFAMALPAANIDAIELTHMNGKTVKLTQREVKQELLDLQDSVYNFDGKVFYGYGKFCVINVSEFSRVRVTLNASTNFYLIKNQSV